MNICINIKVRGSYRIVKATSNQLEELIGSHGASRVFVLLGKKYYNVREIEYFEVVESSEDND